MKELEAGPELDALVAEKVMGFEVRDKCGLHHDCFKQLGRKAAYQPLTERSGHVAYYSTDIGAAMAVFRSMIQTGWSGRIVENKHLVWVEFWKEINDDLAGMRQVENSSLPLSICLAALKAVGVISSSAVEPPSGPVRRERA